MTPKSIIEELEKIEHIALNLSSELSEKNLHTMAGTVKDSVTVQLQKEVGLIDRKIQFLYVTNEIPDGWRSFDTYKKNIKHYKGIDELDKDIDFVQQVKYWIPQSKAFVELINELQMHNETPETLSSSCAMKLCDRYINSNNNIDELKHKLIIRVMGINESRKINLKDRPMNNVTINGNVNGQLNVAGHSINSPELQISLSELISKIEESNASSSEKNSAKSKIQELLTHPLVSAIIGGLVGKI